MKQKIITTALLTFFIMSGAKAQSPYISKVFAYCPAPGQFVNKLPKYEEGNTQEDMNQKAEECISGENKILISLGGYGGYVIFGFDHPIVNVVGESDFKIWANAFAAASNPNQGETRFGGSCEPGIVMVAYDANGNGIPDDEWYELAGSEYRKPETIKQYRLTYYKPDENKVKIPMPNYRFINDTTYVKWESNQGDSGHVYRNVFHSQPYYPRWIESETLSFEGTKLANNYVDESGNGSYYVQYAYDWGYVDNFPNNDDRSNLNIDWAVDGEGNSIHLPMIHFVKVYTGVNQYCGWLGETSTEVMGAEDLHPEAIVTAINGNKRTSSITLLTNPVHTQLIVASDKQQTVTLYNQMGQKLGHYEVQSGTNYIPCQQLSKGIYFLVTETERFKFIKS